MLVLGESVLLEVTMGDCRYCCSQGSRPQIRQNQRIRGDLPFFTLPAKAHLVRYMSSGVVVIVTLRVIMGFGVETC